MWARFHLTILLALWAASLIAGCLDSKHETPSASPTPSAATSGGSEQQAGRDGSIGEPTAVPMGDTVVKQLIIMYSGDTLSIPEANFSYTPPEGGLPALAEAITSYQARIVDYNRLRVESEGGDAGRIKADYDAGLLGEHPFMLLDYGGWSRPNDPAGAPYVALYARMFSHLHYTAAGSTSYLRLPGDRWNSYREYGIDLPLVMSAGDIREEALPSTAFVLREIHGHQWCTVGVPLPLIDDDPFERIEEYVASAAKVVENRGAEYSILLMGGGPGPLYEKLAGEGPFTVVIGGTKGESIPQGYGDMPTKGSLILPAIDPGGREIGICHLFYPGESERPLKYNFIRKKCYEDPTKPFPFRKQVGEAKKEHEELYTQPGPLLKSPVDE